MVGTSSLRAIRGNGARYAKATSYHYLYDTKAWKGRRAAQLSAYPLCAFCERMGKFVSATVADHIEPHKGDDVLFFEGELQSLCKPCHDSAKQREENAGFSSAVDVDGYPIDPRHPSNR